MGAIQREVYQLEIQTVSKPHTKLIEMIQYIATTSLYRIRSKCKCFLNTVYPYAIKSEIHKQSAFDSPWQKKKKQKKKQQQKTKLTDRCSHKHEIVVIMTQNCRKLPNCQKVPTN